MSIPNIVYRYLDLNKPDRLKQIFLESKLYFAKPSQFNDPFEFKPKRMTVTDPGLDPALIRKYIDPSLDVAYEAICKELDQFGVCSFSALRDDTIMWSHYGDRHYGICVGFETNNDLLGHLAEVDYHAERQDLDLESWETQDLIKKVMLRKHRSWKYEKEWRLVRRPGGEMVAFPKMSLKYVIFGARCKTLARDEIESM